MREVIKRHDMDVVGWYHSHPRFAAEPSVTDIENQRSYQGLFLDQQSGLAPFVGLIVGTYDTAAAGPRSIFRYFHVALPPENLIASSSADVLATDDAAGGSNGHDDANNGDAAEAQRPPTRRRGERTRPTRDDVPATRRSRGPSPMIPMGLRAKVRVYRCGLS
ncbi:MAG: Mov34/MPN/PAD-1 family protein, partial [Pseudomonadota bacterium]